MEIAFKNKGAIHTRYTRQLFGLTETLLYSDHYQFDRNVCILTNGGGIGVLNSDLCQDNGLNMEKPKWKVKGKLKEVLPIKSSFNNPLLMFKEMQKLTDMKIPWEFFVKVVNIKIF